VGGVNARSPSHVSGVSIHDFYFVLS